MVARRRQNWKRDPDGQYSRQLGWKLSQSGKRFQPRFRLGLQERTAELREARLRALWESVERAAAGDAAWDETTLEMAKSVARGEDYVRLSPHRGESDAAYCERVRGVQARHACHRAVPADELAFARGAGAPLESGVILIDQWTIEAHERRYRGLDSPIAVPLLPEFVRRLPQAAGAAPEAEAEPASPAPAATLHQAMDAYIAWAQSEYFDEGLGRLTDNGYTKIKEVKTLKNRHEDVSLPRLGFEEIRQMVGYWRRRPRKKTADGSGERITRKSAQNYIGELKRFFAWLHTSTTFAWRRPEDFYEIDFRVPTDPVEKQRGLVQAQVFSLEELRLLNRYATPEERLYLLLGLNCGFGMKEIATLEVGEVRLREAHAPDHQELLRFETTAEDSFIKRVRRKNAIYGEWLLFPQTVRMLEWALQRSRRRRNASSHSRLLLNGAGKPLDTPTASGNRNQQIPNAFARLVHRVQEDGGAVQSLSFGKLRKTAGDLIRRFADGETAGVFLCHGRAVASDDLADVYTNRPYGKCFRAIREVEAYLAPVFAEASEDPTKAKRSGRAIVSVLERVAAAHREGKTVRQIASALKLPGPTVYRHLRKLAATSGTSPEQQ